MCVEISSANTLLQLGFGANAVMPFLLSTINKSRREIATWYYKTLRTNVPEIPISEAELRDLQVFMEKSSPALRLLRKLMWLPISISGIAVIFSWLGMTVAAIEPNYCIPESLVKIYAFVVLLVLPLVYFLWLTATNSLADFLMRSWAGRPRHVYRYDAQLFRIHMKAKEDLRKFRSDTRRIIVEHELKLYKVRWQRYTTRVKRSWVRLRDLLWGR
jgi:hypothetical protein